jgi:hypothetical protein
MVALQLPLWGKALCKYPAFLVNQDTGKCRWALLASETFETNTREVLTIDNLVPIGFI